MAEQVDYNTGQFMDHGSLARQEGMTEDEAAELAAHRLPETEMDKAENSYPWTGTQHMKRILTRAERLSLPKWPGFDGTYEELSGRQGDDKQAL